MRIRPLAILVALSASAGVAHAEPSRSPQAGDTYEIVMTQESSQTSADGSSGSSSDKDTIVERVIGVRQDGLELEYDLPKGTTAEERARVWQFPVRIFEPAHGPFQLLNRAELETRLDGWLKAANWTRAACGHWIFTWNAFQIECDPQSVIDMLQAIDLRSAEVREGAPYQDPKGRGTAQLHRENDSSSGARFVAEVPIDPEAVRREQAQSDVAVGEIMGKPVTLEAALHKRAKDKVSGTIAVTFETDARGILWRRTKVIKIQTIGPDGKSETNTVTQTLERRPISERGSLST